MIEKTSDISFVSFYLSEFFRQSLRKGQKKLKEEHYQLLEALSRLVPDEENLIHGLESLAQHNGTNEISIFLFDMTDRAKDYPPDQLYQSLPDLVDDFLTLFGLVMEEENSAVDLKKVVGHLLSTEKETPVAEQEALLSFADFYRQQVEREINRIAAEKGKIGAEKNYLELLNLFEGFDAGHKSFHPQLIQIKKKVNKLLPSDLSQQKSFELMNKLNRHVESFMEEVTSLEDENQALFRQLLEEKSIPEQVITREEVSTKATTVDDLLQEYFQAEIEEYQQQILELIRGPKAINNPQIWSQLIKQLRSLKEISMIHGYSGIESLNDQLINIFNRAQRADIRLNEDSKDIFTEILDRMNHTEKFLPDRKDARFIKKTDRLLQELDDSIQKAPKAQSVPEVEKEAEREAPDWISFSDRDKIIAILREVLEQTRGRIAAYHRSLASAETVEIIESELQSLKRSMAFVLKGLSASFLDPMTEAYRILQGISADHRKEGLKVVNKIWKTALKEVDDAYDFAELTPLFDEIGQLEASEPEFTLSDAETAEALVAVTEKLWSPETIRSALVQGEDQARISLLSFFDRFNNNLHLLGYDQYQPAVTFFMEFIKKYEGQTLPEEVASEFGKSVELVIDRLKAKGKQGDVSDILDVAKEILSIPEQKEEISEKAEIAEPQKEPEEEDVELIFITEGEELIAKALNAISYLEKDDTNRQPFSDIENAVHNIRSSAHLLNKEKTVDFCVTLEEAAEMFELESIRLPKGIIQGLKEGLQALGRLIHDEAEDVSGQDQQIQQILSRMMLEEEPEEEAAQEAEKEEEQGLFTEGEEGDEDLNEIFRSESATFIDILEDSNRKLRKDLRDQAALDAMEQAAHSLRSSAKMLGFREIAQLTEGLEEIVEAISAGELENSEDIQNRMEQAIVNIRKLSEGQEVPSEEIARIINLTDISKDRQISVGAEQESQPKISRQMTDIFLEEAGELVEKLNRDLLELEKMPESSTLVASILRNLHTLKGSAYMVEFRRIGDLAHKLEDYFQLYREQNTVEKMEMLNPAFSALDLIEGMLTSIRQGEGEKALQFTTRMAEIDNKLYSYQGQEQQEISATTVKSKKTRPVVSGKGRDEKSVKINTDYLDNLINMATDLVVNRTELAAHFDHLKNLMQKIEAGKKQLHQAKNSLEDLIEDSASIGTVDQKTGETDFEKEEDISTISGTFKDITHAVDQISHDLNRLSQDLEKNILQISNLSKSLHSDILRVRMVPIETLFNRFPRSIRDLAKEQGKRVTFTIEGNDTEMDRAMVESMADPLMHILRNAVDHGIEDPKTRAERNKKRIGNITLRARQDKSQVVIEVTDDGQGIDLDKVKKTIIKKKLASRATVNKMTEAELLNFIFYPEFSTREKAGKISGRGVGLDVVATQIQKLKGNIRIRTEKNVGTTFSIRVPLTLVISQALMTKVGDQQIAIPLIAVQESIEIKPSDILYDDNRRYIQTKDKLLPFVTLNEILHYTKKSTRQEGGTVIIIHDAGVSVALGISEISGRQEIVIKSLGNQLQNIEYVAGGTILADGEVALILDYAAVIRMVELQFFGNIRNSQSIREKRVEGKKPQMELMYVKTTPRMQKTIPQKTIKDRKARVLVVDDSASVRNFVSTALEKKGFSTLKASNGKEALKIMKNEGVDLIITDLEMPVMDGFEVITKIRKQKKFNDIPIVILTGRSGKTQSNRGMELGANGFIGKPFKEGDLLDMIDNFIKTG